MAVAVKEAPSPTLRSWLEQKTDVTCSSTTAASTEFSLGLGQGFTCEFVTMGAVGVGVQCTATNKSRDTQPLPAWCSVYDERRYCHTQAFLQVLGLADALGGDEALWRQLHAVSGASSGAKIAAMVAGGSHFVGLCGSRVDEGEEEEEINWHAEHQNVSDAYRER